MGPRSAFLQSWAWVWSRREKVGGCTMGFPMVSTYKYLYAQALSAQQLNFLQSDDYWRGVRLALDDDECFETPGSTRIRSPLLNLSAHPRPQRQQRPHRWRGVHPNLKRKAEQYEYLSSFNSTRKWRVHLVFSATTRTSATSNRDLHYTDPTAQ